MKLRTILGSSIVALPSLCLTQPAGAQELPRALENTTTNSSAGADEIIVTARRRNETAISVPASIVALNAEQIERQGIRTFADLAMLTPSLTVGQASSGLGGSIVLRGIGTAAGTNPSFDQTVSVNIDGIQVSRGNALRLGQIDMGSIEILKGPQALFFGKNSPAGVISIKSADPRDTFEALARATYDPLAKGISGEAVVSGPLVEGIKVRLAGSMSRKRGWFKNDAAKGLPANAIVPNAVHVSDRHGPESDFYFGRATVLLDPTSRLNIRAKATYSKNKGDFITFGQFQRFYCEGGVANVTPQVNALGGAPGLASALAVDDCRADGHFTNGDVNPAFQSGATSDVKGAQGGSRSTFRLGSLEANYELATDVVLTSVTGDVSLQERLWGSYNYAPSDAISSFALNIPTRYDAFTQELRLVTSRSNSFINGLFGAFYEDSRLRASVRNYSATAKVFEHTIGGSVISIYGQLLLNLSDQIEIAGGGRWTRERKTFGVTLNGVDQPVGRDRATFENFSPEATLTYRPSSNLTAYVAYKSAFKSGGFAATLTHFAPPTAAIGLNTFYKPEKVKGGEIGFKAALSNRRIRLNSAFYYNKFSDLQVTSIDSSTGVPVFRITNAASATIKGVEGDIEWRPDGIEGLNLRAAVNYNLAKYKRFVAPCAVGQTIAEGCTLAPGLTGAFTAQSQAGEPLLNAPRWSGLVGISYDYEVGPQLRGALAFDVNYKSRYTPHPDQQEWSYQKKAAFLNGSARLYDGGDAWEVALLGRNLTNKFRVTAASNVPVTGIGARTGTNLIGGRAELVGYVNRGREVLLQITVRPSNW